MLAHERPRRSVLYMPGSNARALEKAKSLPADGLIFDLEDATAPEAKESARAQVSAAVKAGGYGRREVVIRVNALDTPWGRADLVASATSGADALLLPKVESAAELAQAERVLSDAGAPDSLALWCMMETPRGILNAKEIASAGRRLSCLVMGTSDLAKDLCAAHTRERLPMLASLGLCLLAARAFGLAILDGVSLDLDDEEGFRWACEQGVELGFDGKTLIHPKQLEVCNRVFSPTAEALAQAKKLTAAHEAAVAAGKNVVLVDGKLVEKLHVESARRLVAMAEALAQEATPERAS